MNKVMTRTANRHPGIRPPGRRDTRRPGSTPPRAPGAGAPRTTPGGSPPSTPPGDTARRTAPGAPGSPESPGAPSAAASRNRPAARTAQNARNTQNAPSAPSAPHSAVALSAPVEAPLRPVQPRPTDLFADRLLAVLSGQRPVHCMLRHTAGRAYDELAWLAERGPLRTRGTRPVVRDIGYFVPRPGAIEAFARIGAGKQLRAMAFRLEQGLDHRWRCTAVELGGPRMPHGDDD
ncbi:Rv3235 family protein [Streptomyces sp. SAS_270]|uniref:Rv3235 family protein n=1 Tax=Streptomyces sp. SAS_270 TaxID=3412748 RepID=UPI00403C9B9F